MAKNIAIWGAPPPPLGGMTVHVMRLATFLRNNGVEVSLFDFTGVKKDFDGIIPVKFPLFWYLKLLFSSHEKDVHYVITTRTSIRFLAVLFGLLRKRKVIIRVGGESLLVALQGGILNNIGTKFALKHCAAFIGVNKDISNLAQSNGAKKVFTIPGFIPPSVENLITSRSDSDAIVRIVVTGQLYAKDKYDIYGFYHLLHGLKLLKTTSLDMFQVTVFVYNTIDKKIIEEYQNEITSLGLVENVSVNLNADQMLVSLFNSDIYLRPSFTDGDCNTLREAMHMNKYVLASNCVPRPANINLYESKNMNSLSNELLNMFTKVKSKSKVDYGQIKNNAEVIFELINNL